jgi:hypothetical protein
MKNGIAYPLAPEVIEMIEQKRKEFMKNVGARVSQAKFTSIIAPKLRPSIQKININLKQTIKFKRRRR